MDFTEEQNIVLSQTEGSFKVLAAAGSGKTSTMSFLVKDEIDSGRARESEICFISFTRFAADQIKRKISTIMKRNTQVMYGTFHATMYRQIGLLITFGATEGDATAADLLWRAVSYVPQIIIGLICIFYWRVQVRRMRKDGSPDAA